MYYTSNSWEETSPETGDPIHLCDITVTLFFDGEELTYGIFSGSGKDSKYYYNDIGTVTIK